MKRKSILVILGVLVGAVVVGAGAGLLLGAADKDVDDGVPHMLKYANADKRECADVPDTEGGRVCMFEIGPTAKDEFGYIWHCQVLVARESQRHRWQPLEMRCYPQLPPPGREV